MSNPKTNIHFLKEFVEIDGHKNGIFIESVDFEKPILLFLHGGPGFPQYPIIKKFGLNWEEDFTVCYWEQRGTGMSYNASTHGEITFENIIADALKITEYLKEKYNKEKIFLCGHSWGSLLGSVIAHRYPENYHAYIGIGQMGRLFQSSKGTYDFLLQTAINKGDKKAEKDIRSVILDEDFYKNTDYRRILGRYLNKYGGGTMRTGYSNWQGIKDLFGCKQYTWKERLNIPKGIFSSYDALFETVAKSDTTVLAPSFKIPVFIIHGLYDYQTSFNEAKRFYEHIEAPLKKLYPFENSAHSPFLEDIKTFRHILKTDVLGVI
ncbi:pimeloyl-ACP methyl ester carboxylesterase [Natronobacillus azotifigens]|uniref:Alpha/beta hydrolase n=1 Tax=Natronobacillus azotifigens TaxID=472978 RepID=A0A9J6R9W4_9BACI|nr:alpha/beta hydrolase [Natronobacillus azotifigens]MCZ0702432.1 alpha/beta hydrolase [Natronobacillus azotifigens]